MTTLIAAEWYKLPRSIVLAVVLAGVSAETLLHVLAGNGPVAGQLGVTALAVTSIFLQVWFIAFVGYFVASEFQNGTMRNVLALGKNRTQVYLAKLLATAIGVAAILLTVTLVAMAGYSLKFGFGDLPFAEFLRLLAWSFAMLFLYHLTIAAIFTMIAFLSRSLGMAILVSIGYWIFKLFLPDLLSRFGFAFAIEYLPDHYINGFQGLSSDPAFITQGLFVSVAYLVVTTILGCIVFNRADIK